MTPASRSRLRVALVISSLEGGGAARVMTMLANAWAARGHSVELFCFEDGSRPAFYPLDPAVRLTHLAIYFPSRGALQSIANNARRLRTIRRAVLGARPQAVVSFLDSTNVRVLLALCASGLPVVVSERGHPELDAIGPAWRLLRRLTYPLAASLVAQTRKAAQLFAAWGLRDVSVIPNPVVRPPVLGSAPALPRPCLLSLGGLRPEKNHALLLEAFALASAGHPDWSLCLAGDGPERGRLEDQARRLGIAARTHFLGQVKDVGGLLAQSEAFVLPSTYEGFPNALCEAMAAGLACVCTDCPFGPGEIVTDGEDGLLVPPGDPAALAGALCRVMADEPLRRRLGAAASAISLRLGEGTAMDLWDALLDKVAGAEAS